MKIAKAPHNPSEQDNDIYKKAFQAWGDMMREERFKALSFENESGNSEDRDSLEAPKIPSLIAIPRKDDEEENEYDKRARLIEKFGRMIDELIIEGEIPPLSVILKSNVSEFLDCYQKELNWAYDEARRQLEVQPLEDELVDEGENEEDVQNSTSPINVYISPLEYAELPLVA